MVVRASNDFLIAQQPPATTKPAPAPRATTSQDAQSLGEQIKQQVQAEINAATQGVPAPPREPREFRIRGPNGEQTIIGMPPANEIIPPQAVDIAFGFFWMVGLIIIGLPLARAFARRMDRKGAASAQVPAEVTAQLTHLNQAVDAIALEVERISEGQRFTTRLLSEQRDAAHQTLPSGANR